MMRRSTAFLMLPLALAACTRQQQFVAPAPEGAVACAVSHAIDMGYRRMEGDVEAGVVRVSQPASLSREIPPAAAPTPATGERLEPEEEQRKVENQLIFRRTEGRLHVEVLSVAEDQPTTVPMPDAEDHARRILAACTTP